TKAFTLGQTLGASVIGCHIRPHRYSPVALPSSLELPGPGNDEAQWQAAWKPKNAKAAGTAASTLFSKVAERHGYDVRRSPRALPGAVWMEKTGSPQKVIGIMGPVADLLVLSRPSAKGGTLARLFLSAALLQSSRPVLVLPQTAKRTIGKRICIAWNQSAEAAMTVAAAMPLLVQADSVSIVTCGPESRAGPKSGQLANYLKYWGIKSAHIATPGKDEYKEIVASYRSSASDLLVMGAYSRNRMSQLVFGGMTEFMLKRASMPVLMLHT
ncbi:MAG: universal stress protein, partial [Woeseiaceae bacterium]|nr:universal stress protein [Woeseiaceae bacterium]